MGRSRGVDGSGLKVLGREGLRARGHVSRGGERHDGSRSASFLSVKLMMYLEKGRGPWYRCFAQSGDV